MNAPVKTEWRPVPGYRGIYAVSREGDVRSQHRAGRILKPYVNKKGLEVVNLSRDGKVAQKSIKRLLQDVWPDRSA